MEAPAESVARYRRSETRISQLTVVWGVAGAVLTAMFYQPRWGAGVLIGSLLAWLNFRWLKQGLDGLTENVAAQAKFEDARLGRRPLQHLENPDGPKSKGEVPVGAYFKAVFRYALIALIVYVIFKYLKVPVLSMVFGLCALGAATLAVSVHEIFRPQE
jgi:small-conductance mechanosensitive channel